MDGVLNRLSSFGDGVNLMLKNVVFDVEDRDSVKIFFLFVLFCYHGDDFGILNFHVRSFR